MTDMHIHPIPRLESLPHTMPKEGAVSLDLLNGVPLFRASQTVQQHIQDLVDKQRDAGLDTAEHEELERYAEMDDYLSYLNRLVRNLLIEKTA